MKLQLEVLGNLLSAVKEGNDDWVKQYLNVSFRPLIDYLRLNKLNKNLVDLLETLTKFEILTSRINFDLKFGASIECSECEGYGFISKDDTYIELCDYCGNTGIKLSDEFKQVISIHKLNIISLSSRLRNFSIYEIERDIKNLDCIKFDEETEISELEQVKQELADLKKELQSIVEKIVSTEKSINNSGEDEGYIHENAENALDDKELCHCFIEDINLLRNPLIMLLKVSNCMEKCKFDGEFINEFTRRLVETESFEEGLKIASEYVIVVEE